MGMGTMVLVKTDGTYEFHPAKKFDIKFAYRLIGCELVEVIKVRFRGRVREAYLDEEGLVRSGTIKLNPEIRKLAADYYGAPIQEFAGHAVIWCPNEEITSV